MAPPNGRILLDQIDLEIRPGDRLVIQGPSGSGRPPCSACSPGFGRMAEGRSAAEGCPVLFLPQKPYLPVGTLREALFPERPEAYGLIEIGEALRATGLEHLADRLDEERSWSPILSPGEQQRLAVARALLLRPATGCSSTRRPARSTPRWKRGFTSCCARAARNRDRQHRPQSRRRCLHDRRLVIDPAARRLRSEPMALAG